MSSRVYIGNLPGRATEQDIEGFFRKFGRLKYVSLKNGFGFAEFDDPRDADDAIHELDGRELCGARVAVERARRGRREGGGDFRRGDYRGDRREPYRDGMRAFRPSRSRFRLTVENLSTRCSWQDLKSLMRAAGHVIFCDAHKDERNKGVVFFERHDDLMRAIEKYQGYDINGRQIKLIDDTRSPSRSLSPRRKRSISRSASPRKNSRSKSRSPRKRSRQDSRSVSPRKNSRSKSRSPRKRSRHDSRSVSPPRKNSRSKSRSPRKHSRQDSRSASPPFKAGRKDSRSRSNSPTRDVYGAPYNLE
jgi:arginine/serine-rich splicing factor 4/5/6